MPGPGQPSSGIRTKPDVTRHAVTDDVGGCGVVLGAVRHSRVRHHQARTLRSDRSRIRTHMRRRQVRCFAAMLGQHP
eukprot:3805716-Rhodomonas_salina.1